MRCRSAAALAAFLFVASAEGSEIAVTFDDLPVVARTRIDVQREITNRLVTTLRSRRIPVIGFVNAVKLLDGDDQDPARVALLATWLDAGFELGNHTYSHRDLNIVGASAFLEEIDRGDRPLRALLATRHAKPRFFRHPFLHTGRRSAEREEIETFLAARGYRVAPVTIDNSDWIFALAYDNASGQVRTNVIDAYVQHIVDKTAYYESESKGLFGRVIAQVLLVHASALNADAFGRVADALRTSGHTFISLDRALRDPAYKSEDRYLGPAGISWLDRWAVTRGVPRGFFAAEPRTPKWVMRLAQVDSE